MCEITLLTMHDGLSEFSLNAFRQTKPDSVAERDLCLRLEVLLVKMQDRMPGQPVVTTLVAALNQTGHRLEAQPFPGLDHFYAEFLDDSRVLEIRASGHWFSIKVRQSSKSSFRLLEASG